MGKTAGNRPEGKKLRWLRAYNQGAAAVPSFGLVRVVSVDATGLLTVDQPSADGQAALVNSEIPIQPGSYGKVSCDWPVYALYEGGDGTPATGETWGAGAGSYKLRKGKGAFVVQGGAIAGAAVCLIGTAGAGGAGSSTGGSGIEVKDTGADDFTGCTVLILDVHSGFCSVSQPGAGQAQVNFNDASASVSGLVNTTTQAFAGLKQFQSGVWLGNTSDDLHAFIDFLNTSGSGAQVSLNKGIADGVAVSDNYLWASVGQAADLSTGPSLQWVTALGTYGGLVFSSLHLGGTTRYRPEIGIFDDLHTFHTGWTGTQDVVVDAVLSSGVLTVTKKTMTFVSGILVSFA